MGKIKRMTGLSECQTEQYRRDGYLSPLVAFSPEIAVAYRTQLEAFEVNIGGKVTSAAVDEKYRYRLTYTLALGA